MAFSYFLALCPNQPVVFTPAIIFPVALSFFFFESFPRYQVSKSLEVFEIYRSLNLVSLIVLVVVLLLAIVRVVKIVSRSAGALRPLTKF